MNKTCNYYVTFKTNDTCEYSHVWQDDNLKKIEEKPYDLSILKKAGVNVLNITGGEPLLREDLSEILKRAKELGLFIKLSTNGILYSEKARLLGGLVDRLFFALDYPIEREHDRSRGQECFHQVIRAIELARELKQGPIIKFTMTRDSILYLPEMIDLADRLKVWIYLRPVYDFFGSQGFEPATLNHIRYYAQRKNVLVDYAGLEFLKEGGNKVIFPRCRAKETTITIFPDGKRVSPCFFNQEGRQGREDICSSCMRWPYMLPSFTIGLDKYYLLSLYTKYVNWRKGIKL
ncbi:MAG: radical SAM protein [Candidatus Margulisiibacteriota bacterium]|nr:radical SAM protein [Candidatus Margulisiibacteriota bacterium]